MLNYLSPKRGTKYYYYYHYGSNYKGNDVVSDDNGNGSKDKRKRFRRFRKESVSEPLPDAFVGSGGDPNS